MTTHLPVFRSADWHSPADGVWEAQAQPAAVGERPPFEAVAWLLRGGPLGPPRWGWTLLQPDPDHPTNRLTVASDEALTLDAVRRAADAAARRHRDHPVAGPAEALR